MDKITGIVDRILHRNDRGFIIFTMLPNNSRFSLTVKGEDAELAEGDVVEVEGTLEMYKGENQLKARSIIPKIPTTPDALHGFLCRLEGIGEKMADRLIKHFGTTLIEVAEKEPKRLREVNGFGPVMSKKLLDGLRDQIGYRSILIFLHGLGMPRRFVKTIYKAYGADAVNKIMSNPYQLVDDVDGIGFITADKIGAQVGIPHNSPKRIACGVHYALGRQCDQTGSTGIPRGELAEAALALLGKSKPAVLPAEVEAGIDDIVERSRAVLMDVDVEYPDGLIKEESVIFPIHLYEAEEGIARNIRRLQLTTTGITGIDSLLEECIDDAQAKINKKLDPVQRQAVKMALSNPVSIITGGPGTGKTTIVTTLLQCLRDTLDYQDDDILLCAPTGKAAKRISETSGLPAYTIHRALEFDPSIGDFTFNEGNWLHAKIVIADESSMKDTQVAYWLIQAVASGARLVLVGDVDQLASVGPGKVLYDLIKSETIPCTRLKEIYRQAKNSAITRIAHMINRGETPDFSVKEPDSDFWFINRPSDESILEEICALVPRMAKFFDVDPFDGVQVITPQRKTVAGMYALNLALQKQQNGANLSRGVKVKQDDMDIVLAPGDKVRHTKNNKGLGVFNGETGRIVEVNTKEKKLKVDFGDKVVEYTLALFDELRLAYAMTIHACQGSEASCVIMPCTMSHRRMLNRSLYYTGITRAKRGFVGVGAIGALRKAAETTCLDVRRTGLQRHLKAV
ncbi:exodeoxyribonuclease V alpha subunit [Pseudomonas nitritireducens]|uniref:ATP-dependent RecD2 DNA helicase n=1 Tax=Pseudomonas nitroreducens TaxID=46680 RepID=A0A7W7KMB1_PSENT|nr:ATP-dependent RecD-like DNA helicase [Pseudomonas nitritireducens]MBB4865424.1 exodeoxyribonuclease V alpha subunit [Pseudomonas nitritireducens]